jgi:ribosomal-protein-alanine N-acetyltransferase
MIHPFLIGETIYLRPLELDDLDRCQTWLNDPEVRRFLSPIRPLDQIAEKAFLEELHKKSETIILAIVLKDGDRHIGNTGLHHIDEVNRAAEFGIAIGEKDCWQRGYGTEVTRLVLDYGFNTLNLHRIYLRVHGNNPRGLATYQKAGFRQEGLMRQALFRDGEYHDVIFMGLLREEFQP